jgi:hypothetical protein
MDDLTAYKNLKNYYKHLVEWNLDEEDDDRILSQIRSEALSDES